MGSCIVLSQVLFAAKLLLPSMFEFSVGVLNHYFDLYHIPDCVHQMLIINTSYFVISSRKSCVLKMYTKKAIINCFNKQYS